MTKFFSWIAILLTAFLVAGAASIYWYQSQINAPSEHPGGYFRIEKGEGLGSVARRLQASGMVRDHRVLRVMGRMSGDATVKVGEYQIPPQSSTVEVFDLLVAGKVLEYRLTIPEGRTVAQALRIIEANDKLTGDLPDVMPAEGSLLPDTYVFPRGMTRTAMIKRMQDAHLEVLGELWGNRAQYLPISTPKEAVILASVVEKETGLAAERPEIAGLFVSRLRRGMRLQSDPTVIYGVSKGEALVNSRGQKRTLYRSELDKRTAWNTYQIDGLPETPICNPGRDAIAAVLNPPETEYLFFVADGTGGHLFAKTLAEHNRNVAAYRAYERGEIARERAAD